MAPFVRQGIPLPKTSLMHAFMEKKNLCDSVGSLKNFILWRHKVVMSALLYSRSSTRFSRRHHAG